MATAAQWAANVVVTGTFLPLLETLGPVWTWGVYLSTVVAAFVVVREALPETKGRALEDMDRNDERETNDDGDGADDRVGVNENVDRSSEDGESIVST